MRGPISYDVASLLRDAFISWDEEQEIDWAVRYWERRARPALPVPDDFGEFWRAARMDGPAAPPEGAGHLLPPEAPRRQAAYSADLPRFFAYAHKVATRYNALRPLSRLLEPLMGATRIEAFYCVTARCAAAAPMPRAHRAADLPMLRITDRGCR